MNGPDHYRAAEVAHGKAKLSGAAADGASAVLFLQVAQYHATMALAAATAASIPGVRGESVGWSLVLNEGYEEEGE